MYLLLEKWRDFSCHVSLTRRDVSYLKDVFSACEIEARVARFIQGISLCFRGVPYNLHWSARPRPVTQLRPVDPSGWDRRAWDVLLWKKIAKKSCRSRRRLLLKKNGGFCDSSRDLFWEWWVHVTLSRGNRDLQEGDEKGTLNFESPGGFFVFDCRCFFSLWNFINGVFFFFGERFVVVVFFIWKKGGNHDFSTFDACIFILSNGWLSHQKLDGRIVQETCWRSEETCITPVGLEYDSMLTPLPWCPYNKKKNRYKSGEQRCVACDFFEGGNHTTGDEFYIVLVNKQAWKLNKWTLVC